ncbi:MAG: hypothetical protein OCD01_16880 [Fibrobacterales bacterium]
MNAMLGVVLVGLTFFMAGCAPSVSVRKTSETGFVITCSPSKYDCRVKAAEICGEDNYEISNVFTVYCQQNPNMNSGFSSMNTVHAGPSDKCTYDMTIECHDSRDMPLLQTDENQ